MVSMSESPSSTVTFQAAVAGGTQGALGDFVFDGVNGCDNIVFSTSDTGNDLTKSCGIRVFARVAGKTLTMTLMDLGAD